VQPARLASDDIRRWSTCLFVETKLEVGRRGRWENPRRRATRKGAAQRDRLVHDLVELRLAELEPHHAKPCIANDPRDGRHLVPMLKEAFGGCVQYHMCVRAGVRACDATVVRYEHGAIAQAGRLRSRAASPQSPTAAPLACCVRHVACVLYATCCMRVVCDVLHACCMPKGALTVRSGPTHRPPARGG
jgi:hypothetical protein